MAGRRWQFRLTEEPEYLPVPWRRPEQRAASSLVSGAHAAGALLAAFRLLAQRGAGAGAWAAPFRHDPIAFMLDTTGDAINLWSAEGALLYRNAAAAELCVGHSGFATWESFVTDGRRFERRCLRYHLGADDYLLEVIHELRQ
ncbi:MAG: hypothetical protein SF182_26400 [Deltaproteobacteria bacterium]|nr:hypothetical protein [Deltaproteobacteria bacterium]